MSKHEDQLWRLAPSLNWDQLPLFDRSGWRRVPFGEFAASINDRVEPADAADEPYVGLEHLESGSLRLRTWGKGSDVIGTKLRFRKGDVIFGRRRAYQRKLAVAEMDGLCSAHAMVVRARPDRVLPEFLPFLMMSDRFMTRAVEISVGSLSPTINWTTLKTEEFLLPPLQQQKQIAEIVSALTDAVEAASALITSARDWTAAKFDSFIRGDWPKRRVDSLLTAAPKNGYSPPANSAGHGMATLSIGAIRDGRVIADGNTKFCDVDQSKVAPFLLAPRDVLVVRGNGNRGLCARAGLVEALPRECFYPDLLIRLRFRPEVIDSRFAVMQWNADAAHTRLLKSAKSTNGIWKVNGADIRAHTLAVPPVAVQRRFLDDLARDFDGVLMLERHRDSQESLRQIMTTTLLGESPR